MRLVLLAVSMCLVWDTSGTSMVPCLVEDLETRRLSQLPTTPPDLFPPLHKNIDLVGADATSLRFAFREPCTPERCPQICWYYKKENESSWQSYLQTSRHRNHNASEFSTLMSLENLQPNKIYQVYSKMLPNIEGTEEAVRCLTPDNSSCNTPVHARTCEETVPGVENLTVHMDFEDGVVLSWMPPKSKCTTLFEYQVIKLYSRRDETPTGGQFWSNVTDIVTWPTMPCVGYPGRHCHILGTTSEQIFQVQVKRVEDGTLSIPAVIQRQFRVLAPGPPRDLEAVAARAQELVLRWSLPLVPGGPLAHALVTVRAAAGAYAANHSVCVRDKSHITYKVSGLRPGTLFNVSVSFYLANGVAGETAYVQQTTSLEGRETPTSEPITSTTAHPTPLITSRTTFKRNRAINSTDTIGIDGQANEQKVHNKEKENVELNVTNKTKTTAVPNAFRITAPDNLPKNSVPFNLSWTFITVLGMVLFALAIASFIAGYCWGRQTARSRYLNYRRGTFLDCFGAGSDAQRRPPMRLPRSFHEYEELNPTRRTWRRGGREIVASVESTASRTTTTSEYLTRARLHRLPSPGYSVAPAAHRPLLHTSYQWNQAFDPHEYEDVIHRPHYEVPKFENRLPQQGMQPLNPAEFLKTQMTSYQGPSTTTPSRMARDHTL